MCLGILGGRFLGCAGRITRACFQLAVPELRMSQALQRGRWPHLSFQNPALIHLVLVAIRGVQQLGHGAPEVQS